MFKSGKESKKQICYKKVISVICTLSILISLVCVPSFVGAVEDNRVSVSANNQLVEKIEVSNNVIFLDSGETQNADATVYPTNTTNKKINFTSSKPSIASVDKEGNITGVSTGVTIIKCTADDESKVATSIAVRVVLKEDVEKPVTDIVLNRTSLEYVVGETGQYKKITYPVNAQNREVVFVSANYNVAQVTPTGFLTGTGVGETLIYCVAKDGSGIVEKCSVTVKEPIVKAESISLNSASNLVVGDTHQYVSTISPSNTTNKDVIYTSSDKRVATVTNNGTLKAIGIGIATITCKATDGSGVSKSDTVRVTASDVYVKGIKLNSAYAQVDIGDTYKFEATVTPINATNKNVTYVSNNNSIAKVTKDGVVTGVSEGVALIYCVADDITKLRTGAVVAVQKEIIYTSKVYLNKSEISLDVSETFALRTVVFPSNANDRTVNFKSSDSGVATVSSGGVITAKSAGTAIITCTAKDGSGVKDTCTVTVKNVNNATSVELSPTATKIYVGNQSYLNPTITPIISKVTYTSSNTDVATVNSLGVVTGKDSGKTIISAKNENGQTLDTVTIEVMSAQSNNFTISNITASVPVDKTVYVRSYSRDTVFTSSNTSIATVNSEKGYVYGKSEGVAIITARSNGKVRTCAVNVTKSAPIRFAYTSPNSATLNDKIYFYAITDKDKTAVKFTVNIDGVMETVYARTKVTDDNNNYIWKGALIVNTAGVFNVKAYSQSADSNVWSTCDDGNASVFVTNVDSPETESLDTRRPSDEIIKINSQYEGYLPEVIDDPLVTYAPTLGHGKVVLAGETFYNDISREEAYAYLVKTMNDTDYSSAVNSFLQDYNMKFAQQHFDALVMLVYNLGAGVMYNSDVKAILTDCDESTINESSNTMYVDTSSGLWLRVGPGTGYSTIMLMSHNTKLTVINKTNVNWYKVKTSGGTVGYCSADYLRNGGKATIKNLYKVDQEALQDELIQWHNAGGVGLWGLLYRRIDELEIFCYNDYELDGRENKYNMDYIWD